MIITTAVTVKQHRSGDISPLFASEDSGSIVYRDKIDTIIGIKHPGVVLGIDKWGTKWIAHNHFENGKSAIVSLDEFSKGETVFYDDREVAYDRHTIVKRAVRAWKGGVFYHWLKNNCQHFVNNITRDEHRSDTAERISNNVIGGGAILTALGLIMGNEGLVKTGLVVGGAGLIGKGVSRL